MPTSFGLVLAAALVFAPIAAAAGEESGASATPTPQTRPQQIARLPQVVHDSDFRLAEVREGRIAVPRRAVLQLPAVLSQAEDATLRKRVFIKSVLPAVLEVKARIRDDRRFVQRLAQLDIDPAALPGPMQVRLDGLFRSYDVESRDLDVLLRRVDVLPTSLMLAQAALESGWGSSRFAQHGNALFGQRTYKPDGGDMQPQGYDDDPGFGVETFATVRQSIAAYLRNINTHPAYEKLRRIRASLRERGDALDARALARGLTRYSERREAYVRDVLATIEANDLRDFDSARLAAGPRRVAWSDLR